MLKNLKQDLSIRIRIINSILEPDLQTMNYCKLIPVEHKQIVFNLTIFSVYSTVVNEFIEKNLN